MGASVALFRAGMALTFGVGSDDPSGEDVEEGPGVRTCRAALGV